jgi:hypothetical protein
MGLPRPLAAAILTLALTMLAISCSDGKLNVLLLSYGEQEDPPERQGEPSLSSSNFEPPISSDSPIAVVSSSSGASSSSILNPPLNYSSSNRGVRSSASKEKDGYAYKDYPVIEEGAPGVIKGHATRYWDACKPHCSREEHLRDAEPWSICRNCDKNNNEMPAYFLKDSSEWFQGTYSGTPSGCDPHNMNDWQASPAYKNWVSANPAYPLDSPAYTCWDQAPYVINDTLAYAFAATPMDGVNRCGKCYLLQFDGEVEPGSGVTRDTHRALKGKKLVVLSSNVGPDVATNNFDIMIPAGGLGAHTKGFPTQLNVAESDLGVNPGGLLTTCINQSGDYYKSNMEYLQNCVREKCHNVFGNKSKDLLNGCLFIADWYMAADNPTLVSKEVECPQYLVDRYRSKLHTEKPPELNNW